MSDGATAGRLVVTGANGNLGRALVRRLVAEGRAVRCLVRSERAADVLRRLAVPPEVVVIDWRDAEGLARATTGCEALVHLVGILKESPGARYRDAHEDTARALAAAAKRSGFRRVVYLSILGARPDSPNACLASKGRAEAILLESPLATTVLRVPMVLGDGDPATQVLRARARATWVLLTRGGASLEQPIDADDVVEAIVSALSRPELIGRALDLAGPESLPHRELVRRAAALAGGRPRIVPIPLPLVRAFAAFAARWLPRPPLTPAMLGVLEHDDRIDPAPTCRALGIELTPLDDTLRRCLAGTAG